MSKKKEEIMTVCEISPSLRELIKEFRFRKSGNKLDAVVMKISNESNEIELDEEMVDTSLADLTSTLPSHQPRYVLLSYKLEIEQESRTTFPLVFIFLSPRDCCTELMMKYAGSKLYLQSIVDCGGKCFELRELEEFDEEWLVGKLKR